MGTESVFEVVHAVLSAEPISVDQAIAAVESDTAGAVVSFSGVVRNHDGGKAVERLSYSAHPTAHQVMADVVARLVAEHSGGGSATHSRCGSGPRTASACWRLAILRWSVRYLQPTVARPLPCVPNLWTGSRSRFPSGRNSSSPTAPSNGSGAGG